jgi:pyrroline-5-carboxylate reductase
MACSTVFIIVRGSSVSYIALSIEAMSNKEAHITFNPAYPTKAATMTLLGTVK